MPKKMINGREIELNRKHVNWGHLILHIVLLGVCLISIFPFIWMISSSLKDSELIFSFPPQMIPNPVTWQNYPEAWKATAMGRAMINSLFIAVVTSRIPPSTGTAEPTSPVPLPRTVTGMFSR